MKEVLKYLEQALGSMIQKAVLRPEQIGNIGTFFFLNRNAGQVRIETRNILMEVGDSRVFPKKLNQGRKLVKLLGTFQLGAVLAVGFLKKLQQQIGVGVQKNRVGNSWR